MIIMIIFNENGSIILFVVSRAWDWRMAFVYSACLALLMMMRY